jgi:hypothetical protein
MQKRKYFELILHSILVTILLTSCTKYDSPKLPDVDTKTFSFEEILQKHRKLKERVQTIPTPPCTTTT